MCLDLVGDVGGPQADLRGDAADVDTGSAQGAGLDQGHAGTALDRLDGGGKCRTAAANDRDVQGLLAALGATVAPRGLRECRTIAPGADRLEQALGAHLS